MSGATIYELRREATLLSARIEAVEMTARYCRGLAALSHDAAIASNATEQAIRAERAALRMASRLSRIAEML